MGPVVRLGPLSLPGWPAVSRALRYALIAGCAVVSILLFLLASAAENSSFFDRHYSWLLGLNAFIAVALLLLVLLLLSRLYKRYRRGKFGSRLMARLVWLFAVIGILPGIVIYLVSVQFVSRSIESWFDVRVESALEAGLNLGRVALDSSLADLSSRGRSLALELSELSDSGQITLLSRLRDQSVTQEALIVSASGNIIASAGSSLGVLVPELPTTSMLHQARVSRSYAQIEGGNELYEDNASPSTSAVVPHDPSSLRLRVVVMIPTASNDLDLQSEVRYLQLLEPVPPLLADNAEALRVAYSEYQERSLARSGLRQIYLITLTLTLLLAIFAALTSAFLIASDLIRPLLLLAEGTKAVAEGNLSPRPIVASADELGTLTQSFNTMTRQLAEARTTVEKNRAELESAKAYLESVLANMSAGVMVLDEHFRLVTCNDSVTRILQQDCSAFLGQPLLVIPEWALFAEAVTHAFADQQAQAAANEDGRTDSHWQKQIVIPGQGGDVDSESDITLLARGSSLPLSTRGGHVVVFDDISDVISAQRSIAWGEVARRLAHEIKNPLTPIQLSAERLQMKLLSKLDEPEAAMLTRSTTTIVNQVSAMKRMVDNFRDYARTPPAVLAELDLNALTEEILGLYLAGDSRDTIHAELDPALPLILGDETQLRQVVHNLLQNAQDAVAERPDKETPAHIELKTEAIHYPDSEGQRRSAVRLSISDNGPGFAAKILARAFEPYVTSKPRGTGLGLAMVRKIVEEHGGRIDIRNCSTSGGARISILLLKLVQEY